MKEEIYDVIAKTLSGEIKSENPELNKWLNEKPSNRKIFNSLKFHWGQYGTIHEVSGEEVFNRINQRIQMSNPAKQQSSSKHFWIYFGKIAAVLLVAAGLAWTFYPYNQQLKKDAPITLIEKSNPKGQKTTFTLSDGTIVRLNASSQLEFPSKFDQDRREVFLKGEAFFEVTRNEKKPFIVHSGEIETTVLGTAFNVRAYPDQNEVKVALVSGKVLVKNIVGMHSVDRSSLQITLEPNQMAQYDPEINTITKSTFKLEEVTGWKDGVLVLKNANLEQIQRSLENWYGVKVTYANSRNEEGDITANYYNEPLENVLKSLGYTLRFGYTISDNDIEIRFSNLKSDSK